MTAEGVVVAGRAYCDLLFLDLDAFPKLGRESYAGDLAVFAGGGAFITAAHLASLGRRATLLTHLGNDPFSRLVGEAIDRSGIDQSRIVRLDRPLPRVTAAIVAEGDRAFVTRSAPAPQAGGWREALDPAAAGWLHVADAASLEDFPTIVEEAKAAGLKVSLDCGWHEAALRRGAIWRLLPQVDLFLPNAAEAAALCGEDEARMDAARVARRIAEAGPLVVVKDGARGAVACSGVRILRRAAPRVEVVDATGAGDAFNAGMLHGLASGWPLERALALACALGAWTVQRPGGAAEAPSPAALAALGAPAGSS